MTKGDAALVRVLLARGASPNRWIEEWSYPAGPPHASPISLAAEGGHVEILRLLLEKVKKPTPPKERMPGVDPLAIAASPTIAEMLLARGAKVTDEALAAFLRQGWLDVVRAALEATGKKLGKPLDGERSALDEALAGAAPLDIVERQAPARVTSRRSPRPSCHRRQARRSRARAPRGGRPRSSRPPTSTRRSTARPAPALPTWSRRASTMLDPRR